MVCSVEHVEDSRVSINSWLQSVLCQQSRLEVLHMSFSFFVFLLFSLSEALCYDRLVSAFFLRSFPSDRGLDNSSERVLPALQSSFWTAGPADQHYGSR